MLWPYQPKLRRKISTRTHWPAQKGPDATIRSRAIDLHYQTREIQKIWDSDRYYRLCRALGLTSAEVASLVGLQHGHCRGCLKQNKFPRPVCILLSLIEARELADVIPDLPDPPIMPILNNG